MCKFQIRSLLVNTFTINSKSRYEIKTSRMTTYISSFTIERVIAIIRNVTF